MKQFLTVWRMKAEPVNKRLFYAPICAYDHPVFAGVEENPGNKLNKRHKKQLLIFPCSPFWSSLEHEDRARDPT